MSLKSLLKSTDLVGLSIGSELWWDKLASVGTPLQITRDNGTTELVFIWRKPTTSPQHTSVYIDINGVINHHDFDAAQLAQFENSDVFYYICSAPSSWNGTYALIPVTEEAKQPEYHGSREEQISQHRNWIIKRREYHIADPLNKRNLPMCEWGQMHSRVYLDPSVIHSAWGTFDRNKGKAELSARCHEHRFHSEILQQERRFWSYSTALNGEKNLPLIIVLDGQTWTQSIPIMSALDTCTQQKLLPPAVYLMIDVMSMTQRSIDLPCNPIFWKSVIEEFMPMISSKYHLTSERDNTVVTGQSYGGLSAVYALLNWPEKFAKAVSQSGSFWWPNDSLIHNSHQSDIVQQLPESLYLDQYIDTLGTHYQHKIYMEAGKREGMMAPLSEHIHQKLKENKHNSIIELYDGGHDSLLWREGLIKGLIWLFAD